LSSTGSSGSNPGSIVNDEFIGGYEGTKKLSDTVGAAA
jgi:hypothetical protein